MQFRLIILFFLTILLPEYGASAEFSDTCGKEWEWRNPNPQGYTLYDVAWSEEQRQFVTVGQYGTIMSSSDYRFIVYIAFFNLVSNLPVNCV